MKSSSGTVGVNFGGEQLVLLPGRALWWPATLTLVIADLHLGKAAAFRTLGVPVPSGSTRRDLMRLAALIDQTQPQRLVILGDFLHARAGRQRETFDEMSLWRRNYDQLQILLVRGNHDRSAGRALEEWNIQEFDEPHDEPPLSFLHHPEHDSAHPALAGHVHPVTHLRDFDGSAVRTPCFVIDEWRLILPAFGTFTGGYAMPARPGRRMFLVTPQRVVPLPQRQPEA